MCYVHAPCACVCDSANAKKILLHTFSASLASSKELNTLYAKRLMMIFAPLWFWLQPYKQPLHLPYSLNVYLGSLFYSFECCAIASSPIFRTRWLHVYHTHQMNAKEQSGKKYHGENCGHIHSKASNLIVHCIECCALHLLECFFLPLFCCSIFLHFSSSFRYWFRFGCECVGVYLCIIHQPNEALKKYTEWRVNAEKSAWKPMACGAESWDSLSHLENRSWHKICWCGIFMPFKSFSLSHSLWLRTSSPPSLCDSVSLCGKNCIIVRLLNCLRPNERLPSEYRERWESECERIWYGAVLCCCVPNRQFVFSDSLLIHTLNAVGFLLAFGSFGLAFGSLFGRGSGRWLVCMC